MNSNSSLPVPSSAALFDIRERVFILTGGAGMLGRRFAPFLAGCGAHIVVADIDPQQAEEAARLASSNTRCLAVPTDITNPDSVRVLVQTVQSEFGRIDGLINNAALDPKFGKEHIEQAESKGDEFGIGAFETFPLSSWQASLSVDLTGTFLCTQAVAPVFRAQGRGVVLNIASMYGVVAPDQALYERSDSSTRSFKPVTYSVTKSAILGFTRYLAAYWGQAGIRVNALTPGGIFNDHDDEFTSRYNVRVPMGRMAQRDELLGAVLFLLSDASSYMTGANVVVDGGWTAW